jgi:hypothetical protein
VWLDETEIKVGDTLLDKIDEGLVNCRFGVVILSPRSIEKVWTRRELAGLVARQDAEERTILLPVWLDLDATEVARHLPSLAAIKSAQMFRGLDNVNCRARVSDGCAAPATNCNGARNTRG